MGRLKGRISGWISLGVFLLLSDLGRGEERDLIVQVSTLNSEGVNISSGSGEESSSSSQVYTVHLNGSGRSISHSITRDNSVMMSDSAQIIFPQSLNFQGQRANSGRQEKHPKVPVHVLRALSSQTDFSQIVREYVKNVDIKRTENGEEILVNLEGQVISDDHGQNIVLSSGSFPKAFIGKVADRNGQNISTTVLRAPSGNGFERMGPSSRFGPLPPSMGKSPQIAVCKPEETTVQLPVTFEPHIIYYPKCVRIERCGGCCGSDFLGCEPSEVTTVQVPVRKLAYVGDGNNTDLKFLTQEDVPLEKHTKCECRCRVKEQDCGVHREYKENECLCACRNWEEHERCVADSQMAWDSDTCTCSCREIKDCNSGYLFDLQTCQCSPLPSRPRHTRIRRNQTRKGKK